MKLAAMWGLKFLNSITGGCSHENTFRSDLQSVLLGIIHEVLAQGIFQLLVPTVCIWAVDVVDVVIFELVDKKVTRHSSSNISPAEYC